MRPVKNRNLPGRIGLFVFLLLSVAVVSTQAETAPGQTRMMEPKELSSGPLFLKASNIAIQLFASRQASSAER